MIITPELPIAPFIVIYDKESGEEIKLVTYVDSETKEARYLSTDENGNIQRTEDGKGLKEEIYPNKIRIGIRDIELLNSIIGNYNRIQETIRESFRVTQEAATKAAKALREKSTQQQEAPHVPQDPE